MKRKGGKARRRGGGAFVSEGHSTWPSFALSLLSLEVLLTGETGPLGPALRSGALVGFLDSGNGIGDDIVRAGRVGEDGRRWRREERNGASTTE